MSVLGPLPRLRLYSSIGHYTVVARELLTGRSASGVDVALLETTLCEQLGVPHAIATPTARVGIYFVIKALIKPGQNVILSPYTIADVVNMVICAGGNPVFADIERETCNIDASEVERLIDDNTGAVLVTHFYGLACSIERISEICRVRGVPLIEDAAQAFGVRVGGQPVGSFGDAGVFSFGMYKNVNSFLGGALVCRDEVLAKKIRMEIQRLPVQDLIGFLKKVSQALQVDIVTHPLLFKTIFFHLFRYAYLNKVDAINKRMMIDVDPALKTEMPEGYLRQMRPMQGRLVLDHINKARRDTAARVEAAKRYHEGLQGLERLTLPPLRTDGSHMYWYYPIQFEDRADLVRYAMENGRDITESYHRNCSDLPCFARWQRDCPNARQTASEVIYLPTYPRYSLNEIDKNIRVIRAYFESHP